MINSEEAQARGEVEEAQVNVSKSPALPRQAGGDQRDVSRIPYRTWRPSCARSKATDDRHVEGRAARGRENPARFTDCAESGAPEFFAGGETTCGLMTAYWVCSEGALDGAAANELVNDVN